MNFKGKMDSGAIIGGVIGGALTVAGYFLVSRWQRQKAKEDRDLSAHFEDIRILLEATILPMAKNLIKMGGQLYYEPSYGVRYLVTKKYNFEEQEVFKCFELHFPAMTQEWKGLHEKALKYSDALKKLETKRNIIEVIEMIENGHEDETILEKGKNSYEYAREQLFAKIQELQEQFKEFAKRSNHKIVVINTYGIGREFKKLRKCPICKKF